MLSKTILIISFIFLTSACDSTDVNYGDMGDVFFASNVSYFPVNLQQPDKEIYDKIYDAAFMWYKPFRSENKTIFTAFKGRPVQIKIEIDPNFKDLEEGGTGFRINGLDSCTIFLANYNINFLDIAHQLGHCIGFKHDSLQQSLMSPLPFKSDTINITGEMKFYLDQIKYINPVFEVTDIK